MDADLGLRERKKLRTRQLIADTARQLFIERSFEEVSVSEIARRADVSEATVFNYFPTKEDLVYQGMEAFETLLLAAIKERPVGMSVLQAFGRFVAQPRGLLAAQDQAAQESLLSISQMIAASPALRAREHQVLARYTDALAGLLAEETGAGPNDLRPWAVAHALIGLHSGLINYVRRRLLEGPPDLRRLAGDVRRESNRALQLLGTGLEGYAVKRPGP